MVRGALRIVLEIRVYLAMQPYSENPEVNLIEIGISIPIPSLALSILKACRIELIVMKRVFCTIYLPGQILIQEFSMRGSSLCELMATNLLPNPNAGRKSLRSASRNRSGRNSFVLAPYSFSSRRRYLYIGSLVEA